MIAWFTALALAGDIMVESAITDVVVFADRAQITRTVTADVPAGRADLLFDGLPAQLIASSLAAEGEGAATLLGTDLRPVRGSADVDARRRALTEQRDKLSATRRVDADRVARLQADLTFLASVKPIAPGSVQPGLFLADDVAVQLTAVARAVGADTERLLLEQRAAEARIREVDAEIARLDRESSALGQSRTDTARVAVGLDASRAGKVTVRLRYLVTGASWTPHYDARFDPKSRQARLELSGDISQRTGEDWSGVRLVVSTADPNRSTAPPRLDPFILQEGGGYARASANRSAAGSFELVAPAREAVPSDGSRRRVILDEIKLNPELRHEIVPRRGEAAYLVAHATNPAAYGLLPGPISSYMGSSYVGDGTLGLVAPGGDLDLSFGADDRVKVKRIRLEGVTSDAKPLGNKERARYGFKTTITNRTGQPIRARIADQVPVSRDAQFTVDAETVPTTPISPGTGLFTWEATIADAASQDFVTKYEVSWPEADRPVLLD
jgi:hypothetical protein